MPGDAAQQMAGKVTHLNPGQNQKTGIVGDQMYMSPALICAPAYEPVARP